VTPTPARPPAPAIIASTPPAGATDIQSAGRGKFNWPVSGKVVSNFGARGGNQQSNGITILANAGTSVKASAPGEVIYAGSEVPEYGNLVLISHDGGFVTVYAHLSKIGVKMRQTVNQGQEIGQVGQSGGAPEPELYFETRHQQSRADMAKPFDPMLVLPNR
jgi:murein DD-endopeptidase MepM/ murein hydrolase activator NlpD